MNWTMLGAIGEFLGALGVIASLAYLAIQVRANTTAVRLDAEHEAFDGVRVLLSEVAMDADLARIVRTGLRDLEELDPDEKYRFGTFLLSLTYDWLRVHSLAREGTIGTELTDANLRARGQIVRSPGYGQWFERRKHWLPDDFRKAIETEVASGSGRHPSYEIDGGVMTGTHPDSGAGAPVDGV